MCPNSRWETLLHKSRMENEEGINVPWKSEYLLALEEKGREWELTRNGLP